MEETTVRTYRVTWEERKKKLCSCCHDGCPAHNWTPQYGGFQATFAEAEGEIPSHEYRDSMNIEIRGQQVQVSEMSPWRPIEAWEA